MIQVCKFWIKCR